jgi:hypothetical protein
MAAVVALANVDHGVASSTGTPFQSPDTWIILVITTIVKRSISTALPRLAPSRYSFRFSHFLLLVSRPFPVPPALVYSY